ncbi:MAG: NUDIX hydrolase [Anaerolineales bacterium]|nr:NUDIX hydrolase [Anaerolineales bacterium]
MKPWKTLSRHTILEHSKYLTVENHEIELPDGTIIPDWPWIITPDFVNVIAVSYEGKFLCFRQTKYAIEGVTIAPVGGYIEDNEDPLVAAKRELLEETGYEASQWIHLGSFCLMPNRNKAIGHSYLARDAKYVKPPDSDDLEEQELLLLDQNELEKILLQGEIKVSSWANTVALALLRLKSKEG